MILKNDIPESVVAAICVIAGIPGNIKRVTKKLTFFDFTRRWNTKAHQAGTTRRAKPLPVRKGN